MATAEELQAELDKVNAEKTAAEKEAEKWKSLSRKNEDDKKANADKAKLADELQAKLDALEDGKRTDAEKAEKRIADLEAKVADSERTAKDASLSALRTRIGTEKGLPAELIPRLQGEDEETIGADADSLVAALPKESASGWPQLPHGAGGAAASEDPLVTEVLSKIGR